MTGHRWGRALVATLLVLTAAGCNWSHPRYGPGRAGHNPLENRIGAGNVGALAEQWVVDLPQPAYDVIVTDGLVVAATAAAGPGGDAYVIALDAVTGVERWAVAAPGLGCDAGCYGARATLASADGLVFMAWYAGTSGGLVALDVATGDEVRVYTATAAHAPVAADGRLYALTGIYGDQGTVLSAWDVATGQPLFETEATTGLSAVSVAGGRVYDARDGWMRVFDAAGVAGCSGEPVVCAPLWMAGTGAAPAVAGDHLAVGPRVWSTAGCGAPPCAPAWQDPLAGSSGQSAIADGIVYVPTSQGLAAYAAAGCGAPECSPLWTGPGPVFTSPTVANSVVYVATDTLYAYAAGGCGEARCDPLVAERLPAPLAFNTVPVVQGGHLYLALDDATVVALAPPA